ncbi:MAG: hypothetical protein PHQ65_14155 [Bacteroidales bacterium]|nr:hypothetical protein [Bacteroidales bacterium]MDD3666404.1 hypothetical protein [Bacteroidales bacterium]
MNTSLPEYNRFLKQIILLSAILGLLSLAAYLLLPRVTPAMPFLLLMIMSVTIIMHHSLLKNSSGKPNRFINRILAFTGIKMVGYLIVITLYAFANRGDAVPFIITFMIYYLVYSAFELYALLRFLKQST